MDHSPNEGDDDNYQVEEDGFDDDFAMELEQELAHNDGDSEDELVMELEQTLSDYEGDSSANFSIKFWPGYEPSHNQIEEEEDHFVVEDKEEEMCQVKIQAHSKEEEEDLVEVTMEEGEDEKESSSIFLDDNAFDPIEEEGSTPHTPPSNSPPSSSSSSSSSESPPRKTRSMADLYGATGRILEDEFVDFALYANADPSDFISRVEVILGLYGGI
ncbi:hypothetical protein POM88_052128 [Heracleum sosnowskyi]|uniref:Uncharacterized protein n=1 Tax=Heracleum sosnowskyi TaxID=360622 RepID=A0AAD8LZ21_9APIA|nr:hypothetical protein POM88_052128 [Heracleum sosnowskyi]